MGEKAGIWLAGLAVVVASLLLCSVADAQVEGDQSADRWVTIAARECDNYTDIRANLARNNIQESLRDLGQDTLYQSGDPIDPRTELAGQPNCRPLVGWTFTFGRAIAGSPVKDPAWGSLSVVSSPDQTQIVTKADVPARDFDAHPVSGGAKIAGAVTIGLNRDQVDASAGNHLWLQGGTPTDPVLFGDPEFAGRYGFGALRCAIDDLNGDNVETIQFPSGTRHMYCYAYYVTPPPSSGTIVIRKQVAGSQASETFGFGGNVSYNPGGAFSLSASEGNPGSISFVRAETRAGDQPWTVTEDARDGWSLSDLSCTQGASTVTTNLAARSVQISLVTGDTVTCTFTNRLTPPAGALVVRKVTQGGAGKFPFRIEDAGGKVVATRNLVTRASGGAGAAAIIKLDPGRYRISERPPTTRTGVWRLTGVKCNGTTRPAGDPVIVTITAGSGAICTFTNRFDRPGAIHVRGVSIGGLGTAAYLTSPRLDPRVQIRQFAHTSRQAVPAAASGQPTDHLKFGSYVIQQSAVAAAPGDEWTLIAVTCDGHVKPFAQGRVVVTITRAAPVQRCTFINLRQRAPAPPPPEPPTPTPTPEPTPTPVPAPVPGGATPDLALTKRLASAADAQSATPTFVLRVTNRSAVGATRVVIADRLAAGTTLISAQPSQGRCFTRGTRLLLCTLGDLDPRASATVRVRVQRQDTNAGVNVAATGSGSPEDVLANNVAAARISRLQQAPTACAASASPIARAAC